MARAESTAMAGVAVAQAAPPSGGSELRDAIDAGTRDFDAVRADVLALPPFQHLAAVMPGPDLAFGGGMLLVIMLVHAAGVRWVTNHVARRQERIAERPTTWRADALMSGAVLMLLEGLNAETALARVRQHHPWARPDSHHWLALRWLEMNNKEK